MKTTKMLMVCLVVFAFCSGAFAAEYWVIKDKSGKLVVVEEKPLEADVIVKGPFTTRSEAEVIISGPAAAGRVDVPPVAPAPPGVKPAPAPPGPPPAPPGR